MTATPTTPTRTRSHLFTVTPEHLLPRDVADLPASVAPAHEKAWRLFDRVKELDAQRRVARDAAAAAPHQDRAAATAAAAAGEPAPEPEHPRKVAAVHDLDEQREATEKALKGAVLELYDRVAESRDELQRGADEAVARTTAELATALDTLRDHCVNLAGVRELAKRYREFDGNPRSTVLGASAPARESLLKQEEKVKARILSRSGGMGLVEVALPDQLAALRLLTIDVGEAPAPPTRASW